MSKYILMHKDNPVAALEIDEASGVISAIGEVYAEEHIPLGITVKRGRIERSELNDWWKGRAIPASRSGIKTVGWLKKKWKIIKRRPLGLTNHIKGSVKSNGRYYFNIYNFNCLRLSIFSLSNTEERCCFTVRIVMFK